MATSAAGRATAQDLVTSQAGVVEVRPHPANSSSAIRLLGFFVEVGHLVTDARPLRAVDRATVVVGAREYPITAVLAEDPGAHLVMVAVDLPDGAPPALQLAAGFAAVGDRVTLLGPATEAPGQPGRAGAISRLQEIPGFGTVFSATIDPAGPLGAPVVDTAGRVVGIASSLVGDAPEADFYVSAPQLRAMPRLRPLTLAEWSLAASPDPSRDEASYRDAVRLSLERKYAAALPRFERLVEQNPRDAEVRVAAGICLEELHRPEQAAEAYRQALALDVEDARTWYRFGVTLLDLARWEDAVNAFTRVLRLRPNDPHSHYNLGLAYGGLGRLEQEAEAYSRSIRLDPEHAAAYNNLGVVYIGLKRYKDAVVALSRAVRLSPKDPDSLANLGAAHANLGQLDEGAKALREAVRLAPDSAKAHYVLGVVLAAQGDLRSAAAEEEVLERLDPGRAHQLAAEIARRKAGRDK